MYSIHEYTCATMYSTIQYIHEYIPSPKSSYGTSTLGLTGYSRISFGKLLVLPISLSRKFRGKLQAVSLSVRSVRTRTHGKFMPAGKMRL